MKITIRWEPGSRWPRVFDADNGLELTNDIPVRHLEAFRQAGLGDVLNFSEYDRPRHVDRATREVAEQERQGTVAAIIGTPPAPELVDVGGWVLEGDPVITHSVSVGDRVVEFVGEWVEGRQCGGS